MPFNTFGVATAVTPSVIETYFAHYLNRKPLKQKPTAHISYHEGLRLIRQFLDYSSKHSIEDLQSFTAQWVPAPTWVRIQDVEVPPQFLTRSANVLRKQLGNNGIDKVGGEKWWQWRRPESPLHAEWIEMKKDYQERKRSGAKCDRCILYIHGGAYYFGSVDEHRYQMQRHARKLKARVLSPRYRLAPQFPFPCGLYDCIATYFYLLEHFEPSQILFAGDSAGGGMVLSMLVTLRDQGCPLPAGTILLSPWVDLTHSFPSTSGDGLGDYIPPHGFHHKPSMAWPPPPQSEDKAKKLERKFTQPMEQPFEVVELPADIESISVSAKPSRDNLRAEAIEHARNPPKSSLNQLPGFGERLELQIDSKLVQIKEQIQMYAPNDLLTHPLVSPVQQPSLGGLPPMLIQVGGGELLRDEQIYLAHKAANPRMYPPSAAIMNEFDPHRIVLNQYPATDVQLQVWEDLCHVPHTLSFTRPAKYMYRSVAQFGAWALARAQNKGIDILDDDAVSVISNGSDQDVDTEGQDKAGAEPKGSYGSIGADGVTSTQFKLVSVGAVGKAGDELPAFKDHMIRQRVNRHGIIFPLPHKSEIASLHLDPSTIGTIKPGPVRKWLAKRVESEQKFASEYKKILKKRQKELKAGYDVMEDGERPPPSALVNRRRKGVAPEEKKKGKSWGLAMWSGWGSSHDESTIQREEKIIEQKRDEEEAVERSASVATTLITRADTGSTMRTGNAKKNDTETALDAAGFSGLTVPKQDVDVDAKGKRRRSSASVLSSQWSRKGGDEFRPRSPYRKVTNAGQVASDKASLASPLTSPILGSDSGSARPWDESRRSSVASGKLQFTTRPVSVAAASPLKSVSDPVPPSPRLQLAPAPTTADISKGQDAVKVPGTENTFLNPDGSRPHNGIVAYPFKLGKPSGGSPNPSTLTLDSTEQISDIESASSRRESAAAPALGNTEKGDGVAVELPPGRQKSETSPSSELGSSPAPRDKRVVVPTAQAQTNRVDDILSGRPVSSLPGSPSFEHIQSPEEDPVSPLETPTSATANQSSSVPFKIRHNKFELRDSRLGTIGADGMPTSAWPEQRNQENIMATDTAPKSAPFKIRNPVFDPRAGTNGAPAPIPEQQLATRPEAPKATPFKMRHVIYDPKVAPPGSKPPAAMNDSQTEATLQREANREVTPPPSDSPTLPAALLAHGAPATPPSEAATPTRSPVENRAVHNFSTPMSANVSLPTALPTRTVATHSDAPPPPPPKDAARPLVARNMSSNSSLRRKPVVPTSKFSTASTPAATPPFATPSIETIPSSPPPTIGDLSFETSPIDRERPPLETFVTASEGPDLKSIQESYNR